MNSMIQMHDIVALLEDIKTKHAETRESLLLRRDQMGTVVLNYEDGAYEVEFSDQNGRPYALLPIESYKLLRLYDVYHPAPA